MVRAEAEDFRSYFNRIRPIYYRLFNLAHAITGNCDQAEYCLQSAILECRETGGGSVSSHGFRENLRACVVATAWKTAQSGAEFDWEAPPMADDSPASALIAQESAQTRRILILKYGCGLSPRRIARLCDADARHVKTALSRFETRARRKLSAPTRQACAARISRSINAALELPTADAPDIGSMFRTFQADAAGMPLPNRLPGRILRALVLIVLTAACVAAFWLATVLLQPAVIVDDGVIAEETLSESNP